MALPVQVRTLLEYWSIGVLECWQKQKPEFNLNWFLQYSITPPLHHSSGLAQGGKSMEAPSGGSSKPGLPRRSHGEGGSFGSGFFTNLNPKSEISNPKCGDSSRLPQGEKVCKPLQGQSQAGPAAP
jgi:hypothetical protein